jgi:UrcA family protein
MTKLLKPTAFALAAALLAGTPAFAKDARMTYGDLDLTTRAGQVEANHRIDAAAMRYCIGEVETGSIVAHACRTAVREALKEKLAERTAATDARMAIAH